MKDLEKIEKESVQYANNKYPSEIFDENDIVSDEVYRAARIGFEDGAQWQAKQSPWISIEERLPDTDNGQSLREVLVKTTDNRYSVCVNIQVEDKAKEGYITHWCEIS